ncbi:hypothetical protein [Asanoa siamensis]|uniref:Uncharacterized protein n=1 Tax=Asanoa siamensis TaxID=926357 RepID=A0ABQ4CI33_9ACTN|nr:hypothetical protein [Asanoa siamensis]GIF70932.1 hypothetical protein Asi02nite_04500 [Asanoa siamensis]
MTRKITISVPDDIAERLDREKNVSAFVAGSLRRTIEAERTRKVLSQLGFDLSEEGMAEARARHRKAMASVTPEMSTEALRLIAEASRGRLPSRG